MVSKTIVIIVALVVIVAGIGAAILYFAPDDWGENKNKTEISVIDDRGRDVTVYQPVGSVIIPSYNMLNSFVGVVGDGFEDYIIAGLNGFDADIPFRDIYYEYFPKLRDIPDTGDLYNSDLNIEMIISLDPDVLFLPSNGVDYGFLTPQMLSQLDGVVPYVFIDFYTDPFETGSYERNVEIIGKVMDREERTQEIIDVFTNEVNKVYDVLPYPDESDRTRIFLEIMKGAETETYETSKIGTPEIDYTNGHNIADELLTLGTRGEVSKEALLTANPEVIIFAVSTYFGDIGGTYFGYGKTTSQEQLQQLAEEYVSRPGWSDIDAVKDGRVFFTYSIFRAHLECFVTLQYMAKWLYPDVYEDLDPEGNAKAFYEKFMPFELKGVWAYQYQRT